MQIWQDEEEAAMEEHGGCCGLSAVMMPEEWQQRWIFRIMS